MTKPTEPRQPRVFRPDDPSLVVVEPLPEPPPRRKPAGSAEAAASADGGKSSAAAPPASSAARTLRGEVGRGIRWGTLLFSTLTALAGLAAGLWFARFVSVALAREDWIGWTATGLLALAGIALSAILIREIIGLSRLARLNALRLDSERALADRDPRKERAALSALQAVYAGRPDCRWALARLDEHKRDVQDPGDLMRLADRELLAPLDLEARRRVMTSAKRVAVVTAMSPMVFLAVLFVLVENVRMLGKIATLYGGRPGTAGAFRLGRMVIAHLLASGGVALTEDLLGQFVGQDVLRRLSRRLGEGAFNGALTARIGAAAIGLVRPLPYIEAPPVRVRDLVRELFPRRAAGEPEGPRDDKEAASR